MKRGPLVAFFALAFLLSWLVAGPLALQRAGLLSLRLPYSLHYLMAFGSMLSALIVVGTTEGRPGPWAVLIVVRRQSGRRPVGATPWFTRH